MLQFSSHWNSTVRRTGRLFHSIGQSFPSVHFRSLFSKCWNSTIALDRSTISHNRSTVSSSSLWMSYYIQPVKFHILFGSQPVDRFSNQFQMDAIGSNRSSFPTIPVPTSRPFQSIDTNRLIVSFGMPHPDDQPFYLIRSTSSTGRPRSG